MSLNAADPSRTLPHPPGPPTIMEAPAAGVTVAVAAPSIADQAAAIAANSGADLAVVLGLLDAIEAQGALVRAKKQLGGFPACEIADLLALKAKFTEVTGHDVPGKPVKGKGKQGKKKAKRGQQGAQGEGAEGAKDGGAGAGTGAQQGEGEAGAPIKAADHTAPAAVEIKNKHDVIGGVVRAKKGAGSDVKAEVGDPRLACRRGGG